MAIVRYRTGLPDRRVTDGIPEDREPTCNVGTLESSVIVTMLKWAWETCDYFKVPSEGVPECTMADCPNLQSPFCDEHVLEYFAAPVATESVDSYYAASLDITHGEDWDE